MKYNFLIIIGFLFMTGSLNVAQATTRGVDSATIRGSSYQQNSQCSFFFSDTYYGANSDSPPTSDPLGGYNQSTIASFGPLLQLQFGSDTPYNQAPGVPCDGYYSVSFSLEILNNSTVVPTNTYDSSQDSTCGDGLMSVALWVTSNRQNIYGCPARYYYTNNLNSASSNNFSWSTPIPYACATLSQYAQGAWGNNEWAVGDRGRNAAAINTHGFPFFRYTPYWDIGPGSWAPYVYNFFYSPAPNARIPYYPFCSDMGSFSCTIQSGGYNSPAYGNIYPKVQAYCTAKPFYFRTIVYLHRGEQINAPSLRAQGVLTPFRRTYRNNSNYTICGFSIIGGKFSIVYLHS